MLAEFGYVFVLQLSGTWFFTFAKDIECLDFGLLQYSTFLHIRVFLHYRNNLLCSGSYAILLYEQEEQKIKNYRPPPKYNFDGVWIHVCKPIRDL